MARPPAVPAMWPSARPRRRASPRRGTACGGRPAPGQQLPATSIPHPEHVVLIGDRLRGDEPPADLVQRAAATASPGPHRPGPAAQRRDLLRPAQHPFGQRRPRAASGVQPARGALAFLPRRPLPAPVRVWRSPAPGQSATSAAAARMSTGNCLAKNLRSYTVSPNSARCAANPSDTVFAELGQVCG